MKPEPFALTGDQSKPIAESVETLLKSEARLEELTHGEIDAVTDREGQTVLLRSSQEHLLESEAVRQTAILNALPAHIALLDKQGFIVSVNHSWHRFAEANLLQNTSHGVGMNYLAVCDAATAGDAAEARRVSAGIRAVLDDSLPRFSMEYPCHSPSEERWFILTVTPLTESHVNGAVVMHLDITERKVAERAQRQMASAMDAMGDAIYLVDRTTMRLLHVNDAACGLQQQSRNELLTWSPWRLLDTTRESLEQTYDTIIASGSAALPVEIMRRRVDGIARWIELRRHAQRSEARWTIVTVVRDITERKEAESRIRRLNRMYAMLSSINSLIVRVGARDELFKAACAIALDVGGFRMAWIGIVDQVAMKIVPVASAGPEPDFLTIAKDWLPLHGQANNKDTMSVRAVRNKKAVVLNDIREDSNIFFAKTRRAQGIHSMVALPLIVADVAVGVLVLYAAETGFFDDEEMVLLQEMAGDIAFGIDHINKQERLDYLAFYDVLTGLANRSLFLERVGQYMRTAVARGHPLAVFLVDVERFKSINDTLGRGAGDRLIILLAHWITRKVGDINLLARVGADLFAVVLPEVRVNGDVTQLIENALTGLVEHTFDVGETRLRISIKLGVAKFPNDGDDADTLLGNAELALKTAKAAGERYGFYMPKMTAVAVQTLTLENQLRQALEREEFVLHYQPKINIASGKLSGAEALIRWNDPRTGLVAPGLFIPILEETGLIYDVGRWALRKAISDYLRWRAAGLAAVPVSVNVSPLQLRHRHFIKEIEQAVSVDLHAAAGLELEITEGVVMADVRRSIATLQSIRALNVTVAIDDFGTGFSSLSYLAKLPLDTLKIDRSFIVEMTHSPEGLALVSTVINLAHSLRLQVVAEGVETNEQLRLLRVLNCDQSQGFLFSKAVPSHVFEAQFLAPLAVTTG